MYFGVLFHSLLSLLSLPCSLTRQHHHILSIIKMSSKIIAIPKSSPQVDINVEAVALCPYALDDARVESGGNGSANSEENTQIGVGIAGLVAKKCAKFEHGDEVWARVPLSISTSLCADVKRIKLHADRVFKLGAGITLEQAATLGDSGLMALHALETAGVTAGSRLLIHGAANPFGSAAISLAAYLGAYVIATVDLPHEQRVAASAGAQYVGLARSRDAAQTLLNLTQKWTESPSRLNKIGAELERSTGISAVIDGSFLENASLNLALLAPGGCLVTCSMKGNASAETEFAFANALANFAAKKIEVKFLSCQALETASVADLVRMAAVIAGALAARRYQPVVGQVLSPDELSDAIALLHQGHTVGSLILKPGR